MTHGIAKNILEGTREFARRLASNSSRLTKLARSAALLGAMSLSVTGSTGWGAEADVASSLAQVRKVGAKGAGYKEAVAALQTLNRASVGELPQILAAMDGADALVTNWLRGVAETVAQRELDKGGKLPVSQLEQFLVDTKHAPKARRLAYELIARVDAQAEQRIIPGLINDPSLELRRDAVALALAAAEKAGDDKAAAAKAYRTAFQSARDLDQIKVAATKLKELGEKVDLPQHMGFLMKWKVIGPFENAGGDGFQVAYPPEREYNASAEYDGKKDKVKWVDLETSDEYGTLDLNKLVGPHKGAIAYVYAEFESAKAVDAEFRLGTVNANKIWVNGELLTTNHVYHSGSAIDQYIAPGKLKAGRNTILLKIAQNEQTEPWAQDWKFQFRVCDAIGTPIK